MLIGCGHHLIMFTKLVKTLALAIILIVLIMFVRTALASAAPVTWKRVEASAYGPGLWGNPTACKNESGNQIYLTRRTVGVAHKTLPCNSKVTICHRGVCKRLKVIDRGPYVEGRTFDLTHATVKLYGYSDCYDWGHQKVRWARGWH